MFNKNYKKINLYFLLSYFKHILCNDKYININNNIVNSFMEFVTFLSNKNLCDKKLSLGQAQRIALIRVILKLPEILILDEPTSALDKENKKILIDLLNELKKIMSIIIITHDKDLFKLSKNIFEIKNK